MSVRDACSSAPGPVCGQITIEVLDRVAAGSESEMAVILYVRVKSALEPEELERRLLERRPRFKEVPGLLQKVYGRDPETGAVCGIYFFDSAESLARFKGSELAQTIVQAYEAVEVRREVYDVLYSLRPERGPMTD